MTKLAELFRKRLAERLSGYGAKSAVARNTGFARLTIDRWLDGETVPSLADVDKIAAALEVSPLDLIGPELPSLNAASTRASSVQLADIAAGDEGTTPNKPQPGKDALIGQIVAGLPALDEAQLKHLLAIVRALPLINPPTPQGVQERKSKS